MQRLQQTQIGKIKNILRVLKGIIPNFYKKNEAKFTELKISSEIVKQIYCSGAISAASILIQANG